MGKKYVLVDDYDGKELPEETKPVTLSLGRTTYSLYLSEENHGKMLEALNPFLENAETVASSPAPRSNAGASNADKERNTAIREWAQSTGYKYKGADGNERTLGDRGAIPQVVQEAYDAAH